MVSHIRIVGTFSIFPPKQGGGATTLIQIELHSLAPFPQISFNENSNQTKLRARHPIAKQKPKLLLK